MEQNNTVSSRRRYTQEFKHSVVQEHLSGKTLTELSNKYLIPTSTLGTWTSQLRGEVEVPVDKVKELTDRIEELIKELEDRNKEIDHLQAELSEVKATLPEGMEEAITSHKKDQQTIQSLEGEVVKLHEVIFQIKDEARREIKVLKDAIVIMAKNYEE